MNDPLVQHALDNVWCTPDQDRQSIIQPARITPTSGVLKNVRVKWDTISLPLTTGYFHVFSVGHVAPVVLNLPEAKNSWLKLSAIPTLKDIFLNVYIKEGIQFPLSMTWMMVLDDNSIILATKIGGNVDIDFATDDLYFRVYSNAYFDSPRWFNSVNANLKPITVYGGTVGVDFTAATFKNEMNNIQSPTVGKTLVYKNGYLITDTSALPATTVNGDTLEFIHDRSIKEIKTVEYEDLLSFNSTLDLKPKRCILPTELGTLIEYHDDVEVYLMKVLSATSKRGVYYHRNQPDAMRNVTHNAYSIVDQYVSGYVQDNLAVLVDENDVQVNLFIRHSGYNRPLVYENNRINELYKMPLNEIHLAMSGLNATLEEWRAENLESSGYSTIMRSISDAITTQAVADAYGYNSVTKIMSPAIHPVIGNGDEKYVNRPGLMDKCAVWSYDIDGKLVGQKNHLSGSIINLPVPAAPAKTVELLDGIARSVDNTFYGYTTVTLLTSVHETGYRFYASPISGGIPTQEWVDVTDEAFITISPDGKTITWDEIELATLSFYPATKIGGSILWYKVPLSNSYPGYVKFTVAAEAYWKYPTIDDAGAVINLPVTIPTGTLDVFMDGDSLVEGIDYFVRWPEVVVTKKPLRKPADGLEVYVRCYGFCKADMTRQLARDVGFTRGGMVSDDGQYDVRNDRNCRIVVGGKLKSRESVIFSEDDVSTGFPVQNGLPFSVSDIIAPVEHYLDYETYEFRDLAVTIDTKVQNYLTVRIPGNAAPEPVIINSLWRLYSPFVSRIIHALKNGWLSAGELDDVYTTLDIDNWLDAAGISDMLDFEPTLNNVDLRYVSVHPHHETSVMTLTIEQYTFVERVIQLYLDGKIDLTAFVIVGI